MNKQNLSYMHSFIFASAVIILVYCGEQLQIKQSNPLGFAICIKSSAVACVVSMTCIGLSFYYGKRNNSLLPKLNTHNQDIRNMFFYDENLLWNMELNTVEKIAEMARIAGREENEVDRTHSNNLKLMYFGVGMVVLACLFFGLGICLFL